MDMTSEEFVNRSSSWTLGCDNALLNRLKSFSENLSKQSQGIMEDCENLSTEIDLLSCKVQTVTNQFLILSNTQFTEHRVEEFQEMLTTSPNTQNVPVKTKAEKEAELISKMKEAIQKGVTVMTERHNSRDNGTSAHSIKLKLPHIIGTPKYFSSRYCGLLDEMKPQPTPSLNRHGDTVNPTATTSNHPPEVYVTQPEPKSFKDIEKVNNDSQQDLFFPTRELYRPPSISQSLYKEGSPCSADQFMHGTPSTASSSSNIAQESDRKFGSDTSSQLENKPNSLMAELNKSLHGRVPHSAEGNDSEDSEYDFRPPPPGKGLTRTLFGDDEDVDDIFGENSLFRSKHSGHDNDDLFFDKPRASLPSATNLFSQNIRSTPVLFPFEPPPLDNASVHNATPPTSEPSRKVNSEILERKSENQDTGNVSRIEKFSDVLESKPMTIPGVISGGEEKRIKEVNETLHAGKIPTKSAFIDKAMENRVFDGSMSVPTSTENVKTKEGSDKTPKSEKSFVKSMALGLKINPETLNPMAKPPSRPTSIFEEAPAQTATIEPDTVPTSVTTPLISSRRVEISVEPVVPVPKLGDDHKDQKLSEVSKPGKTSFVKSMAAGLKINPAALIPGSKPKSPSLNKPPPSEETEHEDASDRDFQSNVVPNIAHPTPVIPSNPLPPLVASPELDQNIVHSSTTPISNTTSTLLPPASKTSEAKVVASSIFDDDDDSSEEDLFKPKSHTPKSSQNINTKSLFSPQDPVFGSSSNKSFAPKTSSKSPAQSKETPISAVSKPPSEKRGMKSKSVIKKSIFDDSDSDDELFGSQSINSNSKGNTSLLFSDDGIFSTRSNTVRPEGRGDFIVNKMKGEVQPEVVPVTPVPKTEPSPSIYDEQKSLIVHSVPVPEVEPRTHSEATPHPPDSPLFSNRMDLEDVVTDIQSVSQVRTPQEPITSRQPSIFKSSSTRTATPKASTVKSIFDDFDSDDDLFKSSSLKSKTVPAKSKIGNVTGSATATLRSKIVSDSSSEDDGELFSSKSKKQTASEVRDTAVDGVVDAPTVPDAKCEFNPIPNQSKDSLFQRSSSTDGNDTKGFAKSVAHTFKIDVSALKPGAKRPGSLSSKAETVGVGSPVDDSGSMSPGVAVVKEDSNVETGVSFDDSSTLSTLLPNVAKNRAKIASQSRRPPSRKPLIAKEEESEDGESTLGIPPPVGSDDDEEGEGDLRSMDPLMV